MGLFGNKKPELKPLLTDEEIGIGIATYDECLDYLVGLSYEDFERVFEVATIHREALAKSAKVLGEENQPTTYIRVPEPDMEAQAMEYIETPTEPKPKSKKAKKKS